MFAEIAPQYDLLNRSLSLGIDRSWRRSTLRRLGLPAGARLLDLCCGTGDLALAFAATGVRVVGADFAGPMLPLARAKAQRAGLEARWLRGDALRLPFAAGSFDAVAVAFGVRNFEDPQAGLAECARVLRPGGRLAVLEFFPMPRGAWSGLFRCYFRRVLPRLARLTRAGRSGAYDYLPQSVEEFVPVERFCDWMSSAGFAQLHQESFTGGVARLVIGERAA